MNRKPVWQPSCDLNALKNRATLLRNIRDFFTTQSVLEVETPLLSNTTISDPHITSLQTKIFEKIFYLQTSPEFHMKRLLAAGSGSIFQICKAFRADELGRQHNPEFTMLEWYRVGFNAQQLMDEIDALLQELIHIKKAHRYTYQEIFLSSLQIDPLTASVNELQNICSRQNIIVQGLDHDDKDAWLNLLMSHCIEPKLNEHKQPYFIYDFPISQAALAKQSNTDPRVAERFEVYLHGMELANGFNELTDVIEQRIRFENYLQQRKNLGLEMIPMPENFLAALQHGMPACAGVALGIDRLLMIENDIASIQRVLSFSIDIA